MNGSKPKDALLCLPFDAWPDQDRAAWHQAVIAGSVFEPSGLAAHFAETTRSIFVSGYGRWLAYLLAHDRLTPDDIAQRVTPDRVKAYTAFLQETLKPSTVTSYIQSLQTAMRVMAPEHNWQWLRQYCAQLNKIFPANTDKRIRMQDSITLYTLGIELMKQAVASKCSHSVTSALHYRDGLIISLLAARPIRLGNLAIIQIHHHLIKIGDHWWLRFEPYETKNKRPLELMLPATLTSYLELYLYQVRGNIRQADQHHHLWASMSGGPMSKRHIYKRIILRTKSAFGTGVNPHLFRDCAATTIAIRDPVHVRSASALLGHADSRTTERFYNQAMTVDAVRGYQSALGALLKRLGTENK